MTLEEAETIIHSLGVASKMPCHTYSTSAKDCQRGGKLHEIEGSVCSHCYARRGNFGRPAIQTGLRARAEAMKHPLWSEAMGIVLTAKEHSNYFRWFSSGDLQNLGDLLKICDVCKRTPHIKHWLPTHEVGILGAFKRAGFEYPKNLTVRLSADMLDKKIPRSLLKSLGVQGGEVSTTGKHTCPSSTQENMCQTCRLCWHHSKPIVVYKYH